MRAGFAATRMLLLFVLFGSGFLRVDAQTVPALDKINSQAELDTASLRWMLRSSTHTTGVIWVSFHHFLWMTWSSIMIRAA
jgi:hypothetical protein